MIQEMVFSVNCFPCLVVSWAGLVTLLSPAVISPETMLGMAVLAQARANPIQMKASELLRDTKHCLSDGLLSRLSSVRSIVFVCFFFCSC